jgi:hypothetical protein
MSLLTLQREFRSGLVSEPRSLAARFDDIAESRLSVYENAYRRRLSDCLGEAFEKTWAWLGDDRFGAAAAAYVTAHPSASWTLANFGDRFPDHLVRLYPDDPEIAELARLESMMHRAFDGSDAAPLAPDRFAVDNWDDARFRFVPTLEMDRATTNCGAIWTALAAGEAPPQAKRLSAAAALCVWRKGLTPCFRTIAGREQEALNCAYAGAPLGDICRALSKDRAVEEAIAEIGGWIGRWLQDEMI